MLTLYNIAHSSASWLYIKLLSYQGCFMNRHSWYNVVHYYITPNQIWRLWRRSWRSKPQHN